MKKIKQVIASGWRRTKTHQRGHVQVCNEPLGKRKQNYENTIWSIYGFSTIKKIRNIYTKWNIVYVCMEQNEQNPTCLGTK
jgi:hypothetical protein